MAHTTKLFSTLLAILLASSTLLSARNLNVKPTIMARLKLDQAGPGSCWDSLFQLQSCSGEVALFFLNGETHLGPSCCDAIRVIQHQCWPSMLGSLGITTKEADILLGYCDVSVGDSGSTYPPAIPVKATTFRP